MKKYIFVFIQYFIEAIMWEKSCQKWGVWKMKGGEGVVAIIGGSYPKKGNIKPSTHCDIEELFFIEF